MSKTLIIVESPKKIKKISSYIDKSYIVKASFGHVSDLAKGKPHGLGVDIDNGFKPNYVQLASKKDKIGAIIGSAKQVDNILLATDPDREGEAIAWHLYDILEPLGKPIKRITFREITKSAIQKALKTPGDLDENLFHAQQARRVLDRLVGFMVSPYVITSLGPNLSAGRVQSVAVRLVVDREREIENFKPEEFWNIFATLTKTKGDKNQAFQAKYSAKVTNEKDANKIVLALQKDSYFVDEIEKKEKVRNPPQPLTTSKLQQAVSTKLGYSVSKTMKIAQQLYESGLITYLRTDSVRVSDEAIKMARDWLSSNDYDYYKSSTSKAKNKTSAQDAHEAIRPSDVNKTADDLYLPDEQRKVYKIIWETFLASQMRPAIYDTVTIKVKTSSDLMLKANGRTLKYAGWLALIKDVNDTDVILPVMKAGDDLFLIKPGVESEQKFTQPPSRYSEASLVKELEKKGIGRPSTYAEIVDKIKYREYVGIKNKSFYATELGKQITDKLIKHFKFLDYNYTAQMESDLDKISEGKLGYVKMMESFYPPFSAEVKNAFNDLYEDYGYKCSRCDSKLRLKHSKFGYFLACAAYPKCKFTMSCDLVDGKPVPRKETMPDIIPDVECPKCNSGMMKRDGMYGPFYACSKYPECKGTRKIPCGKKCEKCGNDFYITIFKDGPRMACMGYPDCKNIQNIPPDVNFSWINTKSLKSKTINKKIRKAKKFIKNK